MTHHRPCRPPTVLEPSGARVRGRKQLCTVGRRVDSLGIERERTGVPGRLDHRVARSRRWLAIVFGCFLLSISATPPAAAEAKKPGWASFTEVTAGASFLRSETMSRAQPGFIVGAAQGIRFQRFIFSFGFDATYFLLDEPGPPYAESLRIFDIKPAFGYLTPAGPLSVSAEAFYKLRQFRSNGLVGVTGDDPLQHGVGVASTLRYPATRNLYVALRPFYVATPSTRETIHEFGVSFVFGFSAAID